MAARFLPQRNSVRFLWKINHDRVYIRSTNSWYEHTVYRVLLGSVIGRVIQLPEAIEAVEVVRHKRRQTTGRYLALRKCG